MESEIKSFTWKRNLDYIKENLYILKKRTIEYKTNTYISLFEQFWYYLIYFLFFYVLAENFSLVVSWNLGDFIIFALLIDFIHVFAGLFMWKEKFHLTMLNGNLNNYLIRPIKPKLAYYYSNLSVGALIFMLTNIIVFPFVIYYFKIELNNLFLSFIIFLLILLVYILSYFFSRSINFFSFGLASFFETIREIGNITIGKNYPFSFFEKFNFNFLLLGFPIFFTSSLLIPLLRSYEIIHFEFQIKVLFSLIFFFATSGYLLWHYGLKKYEAFG
ncbi:MAG: ABC-2 family transporter protein [Nanoarchaeota archaeon]|nr:ABC-2 family transporter protein [Nanoarchaeota archaeon]MCA9495786.1 ABC-2 family transporter protein [Nanoarchaeota archaeon]